MSRMKVVFGLAIAMVLGSSVFVMWLSAYAQADSIVQIAPLLANQGRKSLADSAYTFNAAAVMQAKKSDSMPYRIFIPANYSATQKYPLVFIFHHAAMGGTDNVKQITSEIGLGIFLLPQMQDIHPCIVVVPQAGYRGSEIWSNAMWTEATDKSWGAKPNYNMTAALKILDSTIKNYSVDTNRIYVTGTSMGSYGTFEAIARRPGFFAAGLASAGGYTTGVPMANLKNTPIFTTHHNRDSIISVQRDRLMVSAIKNAGGKKIRYWEYQGGPDTTDNLYYHMMVRDLICSNRSVIEWLFAQNRHPE